MTIYTEIENITFAGVAFTCELVFDRDRETGISEYVEIRDCEIAWIDDLQAAMTEPLFEVDTEGMILGGDDDDEAIADVVEGAIDFVLNRDDKLADIIGEMYD